MCNEQLLNDLVECLACNAPFTLAFSGGLDSRFIAFVAKAHNLPFYAVHAVGKHVPKKETSLALAWLSGQGIPHTALQVNPLALPEVQGGTRMRCYACKKDIFARIKELAKGLPVIDGSNASDMKEFRPGLKASEELGVISPLALCSISKAQIIFLAKKTGLDMPEQPHKPCLLTRFEYGLTPTEDSLVTIASLEDEIEGMRFKNFRVRIHKNKPALLQIDWNEATKMEEKKEKLANLLESYGLRGASIQLEISLSGYFDRPEEAIEF